MSSLIDESGAERLADSCVVESVNNLAWINSYTLEPVGFIRSTVNSETFRE